MDIIGGLKALPAALPSANKATLGGGAAASAIAFPQVNDVLTYIAHIGTAGIAKGVEVIGLGTMPDNVQTGFDFIFTWIIVGAVLYYIPNLKAAAPASGESPPKP